MTDPIQRAIQNLRLAQDLIDAWRAQRKHHALVHNLCSGFRRCIIPRCDCPATYQALKRSQRDAGLRVDRLWRWTRNTHPCLLWAI
jgi:hypothetical protein